MCGGCCLCNIEHQSPERTLHAMVQALASGIVAWSSGAATAGQILEADPAGSLHQCFQSVDQCQQCCCIWGHLLAAQTDPNLHPRSHGPSTGKHSLSSKSFWMSIVPPFPPPGYMTCIFSCWLLRHDSERKAVLGHVLRSSLMRLREWLREACCKTTSVLQRLQLPGCLKEHATLNIERGHWNIAR